MMSLETIESMDRQAARKASLEKRAPFVIFSADTAEQDLRHAPFLGGYCPRGWHRAKPADVGLDPNAHGIYGGSREVLLFVDKSGLGHPGEPALTLAEAGTYVRSALRHAADLGLTLGVGLCKEGQFQVHVQLYVKGRRRHLHAA